MDISQTNLTITIVATLTVPLGFFITSMLIFYNNGRNNDLELTKMREKFNALTKEREIFTQSLIQSKLEIQTQTLNHIAKEIHSNIGHLAALININLSEILYQSASPVKESVIETKTLAKKLIGELNTLSVNNTDYITHTGFAKAWEHELNRLSATQNYKVIFNTSGEPYTLRSDKEIILFRLCQEILNNIIQHAKAKTITVSLRYTETFLRVEIGDDGIGFDVAKVLNPKNGESTGLTNIQNRALHIKATVDITSKIGKGSNFVIDVYQK